MNGPDCIISEVFISFFSILLFVYYTDNTVEDIETRKGNDVNNNDLLLTIVSVAPRSNYIYLYIICYISVSNKILPTRVTFL